MVVIGLAGGIASGKSLVAEQLRKLGAEVVDGDKAGHEVLLQADVIEALRRDFGDGVVTPQGAIDRAAVARIVFAPTEEGKRQLTRLEQITHPRIGDRLHQQLSQAAARGNTPVAVVDAALMFDAGWDQYCDKILYVDAPRRQRLERALGRGWTESEFAAREAAQVDIATKRARADYVIDNSGTPDQTIEQIRELWNTILSSDNDSS